MPFSLSGVGRAVPRRARLVAVLTTAACAVGASSASAATYCVTNASTPPGCDATFSSSLATPVQDAIDTARANAGPDTVRIAAGTWTGNTSETSGLTDAEKTTITGAGSGSTTLTAASGPVLALSGAYSVSGLTIYSSTASAFPAQLAILGGSDLVARRGDDPATSSFALYLTGGSYDGVTVDTPNGVSGSVGLYATGSPSLSNVTVTQGGSASTAIFLQGGTIDRLRLTTTGPVPFAIGLVGETGTVSNALIRVTDPSTIGVLGQSLGATPSTQTIRNSTIVSTAPTSTGVALVSAVTAATGPDTLNATGVAIAGFPTPAAAITGPSTAQSATVNLAYTVYGGSLSGPLTPILASQANAGLRAVNAGPGVVAAAPQFVGGDDFAPAADGNLVDAGDPAASPTGVDLLGASRVLDGSGDGAARIDVGAIERAQPPVKVVSATFAGTLKLSRKKTKSAVRVLTSLPKSKRPVFAITLSRGAPVTMTVARRKSKGRFVTLPGAKVVTATGPSCC